MLYCIVGETARGKDTLVEYLKKEYGLRCVCSYTTRPKRPKETDGLEHHFVSKEEAEKILHNKQNEIAAYTEIGEFQYFATTEDLKAADIYIIDPNGVKYLKQKYGDSLEMCILYITCPESVCRERAKERGDEIEVLNKRIESEKEQFCKFANAKEYDYQYDNIGSLEELYAFADKIVSEYSSNCKHIEDANTSDQNSMWIYFQQKKKQNRR